MGFRTTTKPRHKRRRRHRQFDNGQRRAVLQAITGWGQYASGAASTLAAAARSTGSNIAYVAAVGVLRAAENASLLEKALTGDVPLLAAAAEAKRLAKATAAYRAKLGCNLVVHLAHSTPAERVAAARALGAEVVWDEMVAPLIEEDRRQPAPAK